MSRYVIALSVAPFSWLRAEWLRLEGCNQNLHREEVEAVELELLRRCWEADGAEQGAC